MDTAPVEVMKKASHAKLSRRIVLDVTLILVLITLYSKNVISLMYHEVTALVLFALFAFHLILNRQWIANFLRNRIGRGTKPKAMAVVNVLLVLSWLTVMITGILVSKKVFCFQIASLNPIHFFSAALALIMTGVHFGLHWQYFWGFLGRRIHLPRVFAVTLMIIVILFGCWQTVNSSFSRWISAPFMAGTGEHGMPEAEMPANSSETVEGENSDVIPTDDKAADASGETAPGAQGQVRPGYGSRDGHGQQPFSLLNLLNVIATYFSITFLFAAVTRGIELLIKKNPIRREA